MANYRKITHGYVVQAFNDVGECIGQKFHAEDQVSHEEEDGYEINQQDMPLGGMEYHPFDMKQPIKYLWDIDKHNMKELLRGQLW